MTDPKPVADAAQALEDEKAAALAAEREAALADQAKAQADRAAAQAELEAAQAEKAKAMAELAAAKKPKSKKKDAPPLDAAQLRELLAQVETGNNRLQRAALIERLAKLPKVKIEQAEDQTMISMGGVQVIAASDEAALSLWCNAARRACLSGRAV
jgi:hypothetical protein